MYKPLKAPAFLLLACLGLSACETSLFRADLVEVLIPSLPETWASLGDIQLVLEWRDEAGKVRESPVSPGERIVLRLSPSPTRALLLQARHRGMNLRPAGSLYPLGLSPGILAISPDRRRLEIRWEGGWTAKVLRLVEAAGASTDYDFTRLQEEALARLADPWMIDPRIVAQELIEGNFRCDLLRAKDIRTVFLPGPGPWISESALAEMPIAVDGGFSARLGTGSWHFYSRDLELFVACYPDAEPVFLLRNLPSSAGN